MLIQQTVDQLHALRLTGMATALSEQLGQRDLARLSFEDRLALLVEREVTARTDRRLTRLLQLARLRLPAAALINPDGTSARTERTAVEGKPLPPTPKPGQKFVLVDPTKH